MHPHTLTVLKAIAAGTGTQPELALLGPFAFSIKAIVANLQTHKLVEGDRQKHTPSFYTITAKGRRALLLAEPKPMGEVAAPRTTSVMSLPPYRGETPAARRAGSDAGFRLPSIENGEQVEHKRPALICANPANPGWKFGERS